MPIRGNRRRAAEVGPTQPLSRRLARIAIWIGGVALLLGLLELLGVPAFAWIGDLLDKVGEVPPWAIVAGVLLETAQTSFAALAWFGILRAALPRAGISFRLILASYAVADHPRLLGLWLVRRQAARTVLIRGRKGKEPGAEGESKTAVFSW